MSSKAQVELEIKGLKEWVAGLAAVRKELNEVQKAQTGVTSAANKPINKPSSGVSGSGSGSSGSSQGFGAQNVMDAAKRKADQIRFNSAVKQQLIEQGVIQPKQPMTLGEKIQNRIGSIQEKKLMDSELIRRGIIKDPEKVKADKAAASAAAKSQREAEKVERDRIRQLENMGGGGASGSGYVPPGGSKGPDYVGAASGLAQGNGLNSLKSLGKYGVAAAAIGFTANRAANLVGGSLDVNAGLKSSAAYLDQFKSESVLKFNGEYTKRGLAEREQERIGVMSPALRQAALQTNDLATGNVDRTNRANAYAGLTADRLPNIDRYGRGGQRSQSEAIEMQSIRDRQKFAGAEVVAAEKSNTQATQNLTFQVQRLAELEQKANAADRRAAQAMQNGNLSISEVSGFNNEAFKANEEYRTQSEVVKQAAERKSSTGENLAKSKFAESQLSLEAGQLRVQQLTQRRDNAEQGLLHVAGMDPGEFEMLKDAMQQANGGNFGALSANLKSQIASADPEAFFRFANNDQVSRDRFGQLSGLGLERFAQDPRDLNKQISSQRDQNQDAAILAQSSNVGEIKNVFKDYTSAIVGVIRGEIESVKRDFDKNQRGKANTVK